MEETPSVTNEDRLNILAGLKHRRSGRRIRFDAQITFNLMDDQRHRLEIIAASKQVDLSFIVRDAVRQYLDRNPVDLSSEKVVPHTEET